MVQAPTSTFIFFFLPYFIHTTFTLRNPKKQLTHFSIHLFSSFQVTSLIFFKIRPWNDMIWSDHVFALRCCLVHLLGSKFSYYYCWCQFYVKKGGTFFCWRRMQDYIYFIFWGSEANRVSIQTHPKNAYWAGFHMLLIVCCMFSFCYQ